MTTINNFFDLFTGTGNFFELLRDMFFIMPPELRVLIVVCFGVFLLFGVSRLFL